jgi:chromosome segregation ATPase
MDFDELKKGVASLADDVDVVQEKLCDDYDQLNLEEVADCLDEAESALSDVTGCTGRGMRASERVYELARDFNELQEERDELENKANELEQRIEELEDRIKELE